jgi:hypothetical protein
VGLLKLSSAERQNLFSQLRMIVNAAHMGEFIMNVYFEEEVETDIVIPYMTFMLIGPIAQEVVITIMNCI